MSFVIKHRRSGFYKEHVMAPRFTWGKTEKKKSKVKRFATQSEAEGLIDVFKMDRCTVEKESK